uniref:protein DOG1-like 3 n=1 Tax=Erigeron canadensis TaxID=72917 RepID=UPI001CB8E783|nr:protein DOG1-like 3 [Erigeron canadensis]
MDRQVHRERSKCCYQNWMAQQGLDLDELLKAHAQNPTNIDYLQLITKKVITHFENYNLARAELAKHDLPAFLAPTWGSTFENSVLWIGGCRPSLTIRLVYALFGSQTSDGYSENDQLLIGVGHGKVSSSQLKSIDDLRDKAIKEDDKLTSRLASLQEGKWITNLLLGKDDSLQVGELNKIMEKAMNTRDQEFYNVMMEADKLRLSILKDVIDILTPLQAVELLVAAKKLHLSLHECSKRRDIRMGYTHLLDSNSNNPSSSCQSPDP